MENTLLFNKNTNKIAEKNQACIDTLNLEGGPRTDPPQNVSNFQIPKLVPPPHFTPTQFKVCIQAPRPKRVLGGNQYRKYLISNLFFHSRGSLASVTAFPRALSGIFQSVSQHFMDHSILLRSQNVQFGRSGTVCFKG